MTTVSFFDDLYTTLEEVIFISPIGITLSIKKIKNEKTK